MRSRNLKDDGVEENEAALLEQAAPELSRLLDRHQKHLIGKGGERAFRRPGEQDHLRALVLAILAKLTLTGVSPDPETMTSPSPRRIDGRCDLADEMHLTANVHEPHRRHLGGEPRTSLTGKEPAARLVVEGVGDPEERFGFYSAEHIG